MTSNFHPSSLESLTFDQLRLTLDDMQVRYSLRKDATREYLLQVLKRHLEKTSSNPSLNHTKSLESIQEELIKEVFPQPEPRDLDYLKEIRQGNSSAKQSQQGLSNYQTPRQIKYPSIHGSAYSTSSIVKIINGTPVEEKFTYSESIYATIQKPRQDDTNLLSAPHEGLYNDNISHVSHVTAEKNMRGSREIASLRKPDPLKQSINRSFDLHNNSFYDDIYEDNRNCYSDTHLIRGPVHVRHPDLQRYKEDSTQESIRFRPNNDQGSPQSQISEARNSKRESFGSAQKMRMMTEEAAQEAQKGSKKMTIVILLVILVLALGALGARMFIPKMFYDKRTPVIFSETEDQDFEIHNMEVIKSGYQIDQQDTVIGEKK